MRVIPPPRPRPRPRGRPYCRPCRRRGLSALILRCRRLRPRPLRANPRTPSAAGPLARHLPARAQPTAGADFGITPRESLPQLRGGPLPALVRLQRRSQGSPQQRHISIRTRGDRHAAQQTPSPAANRHAPRAACRRTRARGQAQTRHRLPKYITGLRPTRRRHAREGGRLRAACW